MKVTRITNRGRIAPTSPKPTIDSGRTSWSTASRVSTIDTQSPEPNIAEQVNQKLQQTAETSPLISKKWLIGGLVALVSLLLCGAVGGGVAYALINKSPAPTTSTSAPIVTASTTGAPIVTASTTGAPAVSTSTTTPVPTTVASISFPTLPTTTAPTTIPTTTTSK